MPKQLTEGQQAIYDLAQAGNDRGQIAAALDIRPNVVAAQMTRIKSAGYTLADALSNGADVGMAQSIETHLDSELERIEARLHAISLTTEDLQREKGELTDRQERLSKARVALQA